MSSVFVSRWELPKKSANTGGRGTDKTDKTSQGGSTNTTAKTAPFPQQFAHKAAGGTGPAPDPRLTQRCPTAACMSVCVKANSFVHERLAGQLAADYTPLFNTAAYRQNREKLIVALAAGDLEATKTVCRAWCRLVIGWTQQPNRAAEALIKVDYPPWEGADGCLRREP